MYSPNLGRFIQNDPIEFEAGDPNLYRFVGNDPVDQTDPSGLHPFESPGGNTWWRRNVGRVPVVGYMDRKLNIVEAGIDYAMTPSYTPPVPRSDPNSAGAMAGRGMPEVGVDSTFGGFKGVDRGQAIEGLRREAAGAAKDCYVKGPLLVAGVSVVAAGARMVAVASEAGGTAPKWGLNPRVGPQLNDPRLGRLQGKLTPEKLNELVNNPSARVYFDARSNNINIVQDVDGKLLRITVARDKYEIISVGPIQERNITNSVSRGEFLPLK